LCNELISKSTEIVNIAKLFGGGGHKLAGAFSSDIYDIIDLFE
jgi:nanoRNase/pAp phosphatase (c-di-AMP/oligoRNAs hydrolase)